jgi:hypothetical protein
LVIDDGGSTASHRHPFNCGANRGHTCCGSLYAAWQGSAKSNNLARESTGIGARSERYYHHRGA